MDFIQLFYSTNLFLCFLTLPYPTSIASLSVYVYRPYATHRSFICTDLGLTLKLSALETLYCGRFISSTQLIKLNDLFIPPTDACATPHFPKKLTLGTLNFALQFTTTSNSLICTICLMVWFTAALVLKCFYNPGLVLLILGTITVT